MSRVLLIAATTGYQVRSYGEAAQQVGVDLVLATDRCHVLDDPWRDDAIPVRFDDPTTAAQAIRDATVERRLDGITAVGDRPAAVAAAAAEVLGLRGHSPDAVRAAGNKRSTRERFRAHGLPVPWFRSLPIDATVAEAVASDVQFPCVVKPLSMAASRGVMRADSPDGLDRALRRLRDLLRRDDVRALRDPLNDTLLVEGYVAGREVAVEGVVTDGQLQTLAVFNKPDPLEGPFFEETIYVTPPDDPPETLGQIRHAVQRAINALGLSHGPIHAECRVNPKGVFVLEVAARPIGGLCARTLRFRSPHGERVTLEAVLLRHALGASVTGFRREDPAGGVMMIPIPGDGRFKGVVGLDAARAVDHVEEVVITAKPDQYIQPPPEGDSYLGFIFARAAYPGGVVAALRDAHGKLRIEIQPALRVV